MSGLELLVLLIVAGLCGSVAQALAGYSHGGCLVSVALGFIGALLGSWLATALHLPDLFVVSVADRAFPVIWSIIGGALFAGFLQLLVRRP